MDIRIIKKLDPETGGLFVPCQPESLYEIEPALGHILCALGVAERIGNATAPVARPASIPLKPLDEVRWNCGQHPQSGNYFIRAIDGRTEIFWSGAVAPLIQQSESAEFINIFRLRGEAPPAHIIEEYARLKQQQVNPEWLAEKALHARQDLEAKQKR